MWVRCWAKYNFLLVLCDNIKSVIITPLCSRHAGAAQCCLSNLTEMLELFHQDTLEYIDLVYLGPEVAKHVQECGHSPKHAWCHLG